MEEDKKNIDKRPEEKETPALSSTSAPNGVAVSNNNLNLKLGNIHAGGEANNNTVICTILKLNKIEYDNPLLNHKELYNSLVGILGADIVLSLGSKLDSGLINESVETGDYNIALAGLISLDSNMSI